jgi:hypothetical protein
MMHESTTRSDSPKRSFCGRQGWSCQAGSGRAQAYPVREKQATGGEGDRWQGENIWMSGALLGVN